MSYTSDDLLLRKAWIAETISDQFSKLIDNLKVGRIKDCNCLETKITLSLIILDIICLQNPDEEYNHLSEDEVDKLIDTFSDYFQVCFASKGTVSF